MATDVYCEPTAEIYFRTLLYGAHGDSPVNTHSPSILSPYYLLN